MPAVGAGEELKQLIQGVFPSLGLMASLNCVNNLLKETFRDADLCCFIIYDLEGNFDLINGKIWALQVPQTVRLKLRKMLKHVQNELFSAWKRMIRFMRLTEVTLDTIVWAQNGRVDLVRTFKRNLYFVSKERAYIIACELCDESLVKEFFPAYWKNVNYPEFRDLSPHLDIYWENFCLEHDQSKVNYLHHFNHSISSLNFPAAIYFWKFLTQPQKNQGFRKFILGGLQRGWKKLETADFFLFIARSQTAPRIFEAFITCKKVLLPMLSANYLYPEFAFSVHKIMCRSCFITGEDYLAFMMHIIHTNSRPGPTFEVRIGLFYQFWMETSHLIDFTESVSSVFHLCSWIYKIFNSPNLIKVVLANSQLQDIKDEILQGKFGIMELIKYITILDLIQD